MYFMLLSWFIVKRRLHSGLRRFHSPPVLLRVVARIVREHPKIQKTHCRPAQLPAMKLRRRRNASGTLAVRLGARGAWLGWLAKSVFRGI